MPCVTSEWSWVVGEFDAVTSGRLELADASSALGEVWSTSEPAGVARSLHHASVFRFDRGFVSFAASSLADRHP